MLGSILAALVTLLVLNIVRLRIWDYLHIPGPPFWRSFLDLFATTNPRNYFLKLTSLAREYGDVIHVRKLHTEQVVASSYEAIHEALVAKGRDMGGRKVTPNICFIERDLGIPGMPEPNQSWARMRKLCHQHLRQFGDGLSNLEFKIKVVAEDMFQSFAESGGLPYDPEKDVFLSSVNSIMFIITGEKPSSGDEILSKQEDYIRLARQCSTFNPSWGYILLDMFPWLRYLRLKNWRTLEQLNVIEEQFWQMLKDRALGNAGTESLTTLFMQKMTSDPEVIDDRKGRETTMGIIVAGTTTTAVSFHAMLNLLAHNPKVQQRILDEVMKTLAGQSRDITLQDRSKMPYTRAVILETLRYFTTTPSSLPHTATTDTHLGGYRIKRGTTIIINQWALHHDPDFWGDPDVFRPERFLDDEGMLLPADHVNRAHCMPFGAGNRVCLGETLALTRLFLWLATLVQRFQLGPAEGYGKELTRCDRYLLHGNILRSPSYKLVIKQRQI